MPTDLTAFSAGTLTAAEITSNLEEIERYLNGGMTSDDLQETGWVGHRHIDAADFYGSPAPRWEGVSKAVHHRHTNGFRRNGALYADDVASSAVSGSEGWVSIPGLSARVRSHPQVDRTVGLEVCATWYTFETGGSAAYTNADHEDGTNHCAEFALFINGTKEATTTRYLYRQSQDEVFGARKHHSISFFDPDVDDGILDVSVKILMTQSDRLNNLRNHKFVWVLSRVLTAKVFYL